VCRDGETLTPFVSKFNYQGLVTLRIPSTVMGAILMVCLGTTDRPGPALLPRAPGFFVTPSLQRNARSARSPLGVAVPTTCAHYLRKIRDLATQKFAHHERSTSESRRPRGLEFSLSFYHFGRSVCLTTSSSARNARNSSIRFCLLWTMKNAKCCAHTAAARMSSSAGRPSQPSPRKRAPEEAASDAAP